MPATSPLHPLHNRRGFVFRNGKVYVHQKIPSRRKSRWCSNFTRGALENMCLPRTLPLIGVPLRVGWTWPSHWFRSWQDLAIEEASWKLPKLFHRSSALPASRTPHRLSPSKEPLASASVTPMPVVSITVPNCQDSKNTRISSLRTWNILDHNAKAAWQIAELSNPQIPHWGGEGQFSRDVFPACHEFSWA